MGNGAPDLHAPEGVRGAAPRVLPATQVTPALAWCCRETGAESALLLAFANGAWTLLGAAHAPPGLAALLQQLPARPGAATRLTAATGRPETMRPLQLLPVATPDGHDGLALCLIGRAGSDDNAPEAPDALLLEVLGAQAALMLHVGAEARVQTRHAALADLLQETLDGLDEALCTCDGQGRILAVNDALCRLLDRDRDSLLGRSLPQFLSRDATAFMQYLRQRRDEGIGPADMQWHLRGPGDEDLEVAVQRTLLRRDDRPDRLLLRWHRTERERSGTFLRDARAAILERIARREPVTTTLTAICELADSYWPETLAAVSVPRPGGGRLLVAPDMPVHFRESLEAHHRFEPEESLCASVVAGGERLVCADVRSEYRWPDYGWFAVAHGVHAVWGEPMRSREGVTIGALTLFRREAGSPTTAQIETLQRLAELGAVALSHANFLEQLEAQAFHDGLTGLPNRRLLSDRMAHHLGQARRTQRPVAVMLLDVDGFKAVNDRLGHEEGDRLLCRLGEQLASVLRPSDTLARLGGDEFVVVAPLGVPGDATAVADKLISATDALQAAYPIAISIGISLYPNHGDTERPLLHRADRAMYVAKQQGKHRWAVYASGGR